MRPVLRKQHGRVFVAAVSAARVLRTLVPRAPRTAAAPAADLGGGSGRSGGLLDRPDREDGRDHPAPDPRRASSRRRADLRRGASREAPPMEVVTIPAGIVSGADGWISRDGESDGQVTELRGTTLSMLAPHASLYYHWLIDVAPRAAMVVELIGARSSNTCSYRATGAVPPRAARRARDRSRAPRGGIGGRLPMRTADLHHRDEHGRLPSSEYGARPSDRRSGSRAAGAGHRARLYIGRSDAPGRRVINEGEVVRDARALRLRGHDHGRPIDS